MLYFVYSHLGSTYSKDMVYFWYKKVTCVKVEENTGICVKVAQKYYMKYNKHLYTHAKKYVTNNVL